MVFYRKKEFLEIFRGKLDERGLQFLEEYKHGANGVIFLVRDMSGTTLAVKVFKVTGDDLKGRFTKEVNQLRQIRNKNVIELISNGHFLFEGNEVYYFVMEFFEDSKNLKEIDPNLFLEQDLSIRANYSAQLADAIHAIHSIYEKHNDLHEGNILVRGKTIELKVIDPGASSAFPLVESKDRDYFNYLLANRFFLPEELSKLGIGNYEKLSFEEIRGALHKFNNPISAKEQSPKLNFDEIFREFRKWKDNILPPESYQTISQTDKDLIFCCLIPESAGEGLIDFTPQNLEWSKYSSMETYFRSLEIFQYAQTFADLEHLEYSNSYGDRLILYSDGKLFIQIIIGKTIFNDVQLHNGTEKRPIWYTDWLFPNTGSTTSEGHSKFGLPITTIRNRNLEDILKAICFAFNPVCKIPLVSRPTDKFHSLFIIPKMVVGPQQLHRYLVFENRFPSFREYIGTKPDIEIKKSFNFLEISDVMVSFKNGVETFFRNRSSTAYG